MLLSLHCTALLSAGRVLNEVEIDEELTGRRAKQAGFVEPSFPTIAGTGLGWQDGADQSDACLTAAGLPAWSLCGCMPAWLPAHLPHTLPCTPHAPPACLPACLPACPHPYPHLPAGAGPNGAVIHYRAQPGTCRPVDASTMLLLDSGAQFDCGTTDITRTMHFGTPSEHQRACFTRVLQVRGLYRG
jgi:hypothetical protein